MKQGNLFYAEQKYFYVFAKEAFSEECKKKAAEVPNLGLVTFSEMLNYSEVVYFKVYLRDLSCIPLFLACR